mmetsp:Transcript_2841/g.7925  ORF Transcript_2841/g.7925 Transcript_2841/m.7925 type:complete len:318 (+) Transcript_2841:861-1814(+)
MFLKIDVPEDVVDPKVHGERPDGVAGDRELLKPQRTTSSRVPVHPIDGAEGVVHAHLVYIPRDIVIPIPSFASRVANVAIAADVQQLDDRVVLKRIVGVAPVEEARPPLHAGESCCSAAVPVQAEPHPERQLIPARAPALEEKEHLVLVRAWADQEGGVAAVQADRVGLVRVDLVRHPPHVLQLACVGLAVHVAGLHVLCRRSLLVAGGDLLQHLHDHGQDIRAALVCVTTQPVHELLQRRTQRRPDVRFLVEACRAFLPSAGQLDERGPILGGAGPAPGGAGHVIGRRLPRNNGCGHKLEEPPEDNDGDHTESGHR